MTKGQRDYLADLAGRKGVRLENTDNVSAAWASAKIEELKAMPDTVFDEMTPELKNKIDTRVVKIIQELKEWSFMT